MSMADVYDQLNDHRKAKKYLLRIKEFRYSKQDHLIDDYYNTLGWSPG